MKTKSLYLLLALFLVTPVLQSCGSSKRGCKKIMRIHIKEPSRFAMLNGNIVLTHFQDTHNTIIRNSDGDIQRVKNEKLDGLTLEELNEGLLENTSLREVAAIEEYIVVGDHNNDDESYMAYATSYS